MTQSQKNHVHFATEMYVHGADDCNFFDLIRELTDYDREDLNYTIWACDVVQKLLITKKHYGEESHEFKLDIDHLLWV